ncbi:MAG: hypothetical protein Q9201_005190 [Fulgogasparrea decipioides]
MNITITPETKWLSPNRMSGSDVDNDSLSDMDAKPPVHPVPQMQGAFEESMMETLNESDDAETQDRMSNADSVSRRKMLLEQDEYQRTVAGRWKQKPGEQFHPLWKLVAQISFGMHLLQQSLAKSDEEVIKILQTHVDEIDGFLERTTEDFDLAQGDIDERIRYLKLPLEHGSVFDTMLNDRNFRIAIVEGNEKIEHIIDRTAAAMNDALKDVQKGLDATRELAKYLTRVDKHWDERTEDHDSVYLAMIGNTEGWTRAFLTLQSKGNALRRALVQLGGIVAEMQKRAGAASRKNLSPLKPLPTAPHASTPRTNTSHASTRSSSQQHSQHSSSRSHSGQHDPKQQSKHAISWTRRSTKDTELSSPRLERAMSAKRVEPILRDTTPESHKPPKGPEPPIPVKLAAPITPQESLPKGSQAASPVSAVTTTTSGRGTEPLTEPSEPRVQVQPSEPTRPVKSTDPIIAAREASPKLPIPLRSPSRKPSFRTFTERARFHLTRKRSLTKDLDKDDVSTTNLPIQSPSSRDSPAKRPSSPVVRRLSARRANAVSTSTYSVSPTSTTRPPESPLSRNMSPAFASESSGPKPSHSSYNSISFLPLHPQLSPLPDYSTPPDTATEEVLNRLKRSTSVNSGTASKRASTIDQQDQVRRSSSTTSNVPIRRSSSITSNASTRRSSIANNNVYPKRSSSINIPNPASLPDDAGGSVNLQHPLLREARHAKFANTTMPSTPIRSSSRDLPLRHYHSQGNFHSVGFAGRPKEIILPKRTSSLLYIPPAPTSPSAHPALSSAPLDPEDKLSPAPALSSATPEPLKVSSRAGTSASVHNDPETTRSSATTAASDDSDDREGATPPPIGLGVRSPSRLNTNVNPDSKTPTATTSPIKFPTSNKSPISASSKQADTATSPISEPNPATETSKYKTSATNNVPFYLNPVSSAALIDFLASTPPPSSPHHHQRSTSDLNAFDTQNLYRNYRVEDGKSPAPPGPGGMPMLPLSLAQAAPPTTRDQYHGKKPAAWKRIFVPKVGRKSSAKGAPIPKSEPAPSRALKQKKSRAQGIGMGKKANKERDAAVDEKEKETIGNLELITGNRALKTKDGGNGGPGGKDEEAISVVESTITKDTTTSTTMNGSASTGAVNGGQSFMGVGKDGMWISRKNFLRT